MSCFLRMNYIRKVNHYFYSIKYAVSICILLYNAKFNRKVLYVLYFQLARQLGEYTWILEGVSDSYLHNLRSVQLILQI